ncbi:MAG: choloylglycine hydrolase [Clostridia bacterium]|nr:choloylglycine hydrolase [Clostridia bacterium]
MCTAMSVTVDFNYFGRNLDFEHSFGEKIIITPRNFEFSFRNGKKIKKHFAIIGMGIEKKNFPLYFDATNEKGLSMAGLNFPENAEYTHKINGVDNVASFELIPWILTQCGSVNDACELLDKVNITNEAFDTGTLPTPLHWIIADKFNTAVIEQTKDGIRFFDNPVGVLSNNPEFDIQMFNLSNYMSVTAEEPKNIFSDKVALKSYSRGMGGIGLPGDLSSVSRFVKTSFLKLNSVFGKTEQEIVNQFFHILYSVYQIRGTVKVGKEYEITHYTSCCNTDKGIYYYTTYNNSRINGVSLFAENLQSDKLICHDLILQQEFVCQNTQNVH